jgi:DNA (cytosine-5)-methyltransferase 3A
MACGMIAFKELGINIESYDAFEIDKYAIKVATHNFPEIKQHGDVFKSDFAQFEGVDWVIGGSPCTHWSIAQKNNRETTASGIGWELFQQYVRAIKEAKPKYFLYENNKSMSKEIRASIDKEFGFEAVCINSALVSAQNRQRLYWVGKRNEDGTYSKVNVEQPADRGILLKDVLDNAVGETKDNKSFALTAYYSTGQNPEHTLKKSLGTMAAEPVNITPDGKSQTLKAQYQKNNISNFCCYSSTYGASGVAEPVNVTIDGKARTIRATCYKDGIRNMIGNNVDRKTCVAEPVCMRYERSEKAKKLRKQYEASEIKHGFRELSELHPRPDGKTNTLSTVLKDNPICEPVRVGHFNKGGQGAKTGLYAIPVDYALAELSDEYYHGDKDGQLLGKIVCKNTSNNKGQPAQGTRVYKTDCKSICLDGDSRKYIIDAFAIPTEFVGGAPVKAVSSADGKEYPVYEVKDGQITIKGKRYPIKLADGYYIIRKLTVTECMRLQTIPDWYDFSVISNSQAYKCLGNGWTCDVITHLIKSALNQKTSQA